MSNESDIYCIDFKVEIDGTMCHLQVVDPENAQQKANQITWDTPLGKALVATGAGESVEVKVQDTIIPLHVREINWWAGL